MLKPTVFCVDKLAEQGAGHPVRRIPLSVHAAGRRCAESSALPLRNGDTVPLALRKREAVLAKMRKVSATDGRQSFW